MILVDISVNIIVFPYCLVVQLYQDRAADRLDRADRAADRLDDTWQRNVVLIG